MHETPYELLLKKSRQRKIELINSIEEKSLKHRSISYNMHIQNDLAENPQTKPKDKQKHEKQIRINYTSCLKKSYYYRKFLNQSVEGHLTQDQFAKLKEILNRIGVHHSQTEKNPAIFREIWENEIQRKHSLRTDEEKQLQLTVKPKTNDKNFTDFLGYSSEQRKQAEEAKKKLEDITQIAQKRKQSFDFDLEIQGNKKDIRAKDGNHSKSPKKITNTKDTLEGYLFNMEQNKTMQQAQILPSHQKNKTACTFFKRFQQSNTKTGTEPQQNISIKIKKISPDRRQLIEDDDKTFVSKHSRAYRSSLTRQLVQTLESRDIRSTWNGSSNENRKQRYHKVQTAQKCRISIRRHKKLVGCTYTNDIQGWNVKAQNEDQTNEVFGA